MLQGVLEVGLQLQRVELAAAEHALEDLDQPAGALGLGAGERGLRLAEQVVGRGVVAERQPDAGRQHDLPVADQERLVEHRQQPVGQRPQPLEVLDVLGHDEELVGAEPDGGVLDAGAPAQPVGHLAEQQVAGLVAERLVDRLEPVDVEVHQADLQPAAAGQRDRVPQPVGERAAVGQAGQRVGERAADQVLLGAAAVGDVDQRQDDEHRPAVAVVDDLVRLHDPQLAAVGAAQPALAVEQQVRVELRLAGRLVGRDVADRASSGWASRSTCRPASSSTVRPVRAHSIGLATSTWPSRSTSALAMGADRNSAWNSWPRSASRVSMARRRWPAGLAGGSGSAAGAGRRVGGGEVHLHRVTHRSRQVTELVDGESWSSAHVR